ncbi:Protein of unknown function [Pyronema omphalodes CBS 100304]|uniref:Uncharacterized protein n=1 Tax=Pyronema omphalodes (strain CBS 100304) TaxID=1076935 RepID=U4LYE4_PYROM|nr:Protein of unknown function [Pyronema omphalodes CBS 100304]
MIGIECFSEARSTQRMIMRECSLGAHKDFYLD